jgi:hypothetical protein
MEAIAHLVRALPKGYRFLSMFNDAPGRKKSEVLALFSRAIERSVKGGKR